MKILNLVVVLFVAAGIGAAQSAPDLPDASGVIVVKHSWQKNEYRTRVTTYPSTGMGNARTSPQAIVREQALPEPLRTIPRIDVRKNQVEGGPEKWAPYKYKVKIKNTGPKAIQAVFWDYVFFEPSTLRELRRGRFESSTKVEPGKIKDLEMYAGVPPVLFIEAIQTGKTSKVKPLEKVVIQGIEYVDGSVWTPARK